MRWSKLKQLVEDRMADSLQCRVEVHTTWYRRLGHDHLGRAWITVDKQEITEFSTLALKVRANCLATEKSGIDVLDRENMAAYYAARHVVEAEMRQHGDYHQREFHRVLWDSLSLSIDNALQSDNVIIRAFAMLDRRLGKRRLRTLQLSDDEHPLVRQFYDLHCEAEGITPRSEVA